MSRLRFERWVFACAGLLVACAEDTGGAGGPGNAAGTAGSGTAGAGGGALAVGGASSGGAQAGGAAGAGAAGAAGGGAAGASGGAWLIPSCAPGVEASVVYQPKAGTFDFANAIAVSEQGIYLGTRSVSSLPVGGGVPSELYSVANAALWVDQLAVSGKTLFATVPNGATEGLVALDVEGVLPPVNVATAKLFGELASDGSSVFCSRVTTDSADMQNVFSFGPDGTPGPTLKSSSAAVVHVVVRGSDVFVVTISGSPQTYRIERGPTTGGQLVSIVDAAAPISAIAANDLYVFWSESGAVRRAKHDGSGAATVAQLDATSLAADAAAVYATSAQSVVQIDLASLQTAVLASSQKDPVGLTERGNRVYWLNDRKTGQSMANAVMTACKR